MTETTGPWVVDSVGPNWVIRNPAYKRVKIIGKIWQPRCQSKVNYRDRAQEEADRRNRALAAETTTVDRLNGIVMHLTPAQRLWLETTLTSLVENSGARIVDVLTETDFTKFEEFIARVKPQ
jgi:hypothetical protein